MVLMVLILKEYSVYLSQKLSDLVQKRKKERKERKKGNRLIIREIQIQK